MDQQSNVVVEIIQDREFMHRISTIMLKEDRFSRAWVETFEDNSKISELINFTHNPQKREIVAHGDGKYQSTVYFENHAGAILSAMLIADFTGKVSFQVSNDGGNSWLDVKPGAAVTFSKADKRLVVRAKTQGPATIQNIAVIW